tara:strand:- start:385 stop:534 length:150 start_codon:yes stop_codon:yes gene_type:complete
MVFIISSDFVVIMYDYQKTDRKDAILDCLKLDMYEGELACMAIQRMPLV